MRKFFRTLFVFPGLFMVIISWNSPMMAGETARPEVRALWVDAFRDGAKTPAQIDRLIQDSLDANINTLIVQVRRRGDAYYNISIEPRTEDPGLPPGFDALQYLIDKAHAQHLEVHAWLNTLVAWNSSVPPKDPNHVWNLHGPQTTDKTNWISYYRNYNKAAQNWPDKLYSSYYLDPGHPDVVDYTVNVYLQVVKNYDIDGIHLDYSRYAGAGWGYNPTSVARYNARYGTTGMPAPDDPQWSQWRREQTANLVRKIYLKAIAVKPNLKVSSAVITWGDGPITEGDWEKSRAYKDVYQDWIGWLKEGIIDMVIPMNYFNEWETAPQTWYNRWIEWEKDHQYGRHIVIGPGIFSQYIEQSLAQIRRAQATSALGNNAAGLSLFAYGASHVYSNNDYKEPASAKTLPRQPYVFMPETNSLFFGLLSKEGGYFDPALKTYISTQPVFPTPAAVPDMPWKSKPTHGCLMGTLSDFTGRIYDHVKVSVARIPESGAFNETKLYREVFTDGNGWYGLTELPPGGYRITVAGEEFAGERTRDVLLWPGRVTEANFRTLPVHVYPPPDRAYNFALELGCIYRAGNI
jgi:uncharacterized lipoprotein YddW (UPF0748 family)